MGHYLFLFFAGADLFHCNLRGGETVAAAIDLVNFRRQADYGWCYSSGLMVTKVTPLLAGHYRSSALKFTIRTRLQS